MCSWPRSTSHNAHPACADRFADETTAFSPEVLSSTRTSRPLEPPAGVQTLPETSASRSWSPRIDGFSVMVWPTKGGIPTASSGNDAEHPAVGINLRGHQDVGLRSDVPRGFERRQVGQRFGIDLRCQFNGCTECKSSAHTTASNRVLNG